ncbi:hypothetical protein EON63_20340 [archaeon]|nr:MAG: hypothetical protein EON63_20340 [archaeon]
MHMLIPPCTISCCGSHIHTSYFTCVSHSLSIFVLHLVQVIAEESRKLMGVDSSRNSVSNNEDEEEVQQEEEQGDEYDDEDEENDPNED